jgi:hypothetical protein
MSTNTGSHSWTRRGRKRRAEGYHGVVGLSSPHRKSAIGGSASPLARDIEKWQRSGAKSRDGRNASELT